MKFGLPLSVILHGLLFFIGIWSWKNAPEPLFNDKIVPLKLTTVSDITDLRAIQKKPDPEPEPEVDPDPEAEQEVIEPEETPEEIAEETPETSEKPEEDTGEDTGSDNKTEETNKTQKPTETQKPEEPVFDLDALEQAFKEVKQSNPDAGEQKQLVSERALAEQGEINRKAKGEGKSDIVNAKDYMRSRMRKCWLVDTGALDYDKLVIDVMVRLNMEGKILDLVVLNDAKIIASGKESWKVARHNALTALRKCQPYDGLRSIDYNVWKELKLHLDPGEY